MEVVDQEVRNPKEDSTLGLQRTVIFIINYVVCYFSISHLEDVKKSWKCLKNACHNCP